MENINNLLTVIIVIPLLGMLFAAMAKEEVKGSNRNVISVGIFTLISNLVVLWRIAQHIDVNSTQWQLIEKFSWLENPKIELVFGIDIFSLLLIAAVHIAVLLGMVGVRQNLYRQKTLIVFSLLFTSMITGYLVSADLFSFYIFFEAMLLPLFMLVGIFGNIKKQQGLYRFFLYNLWGAIFLFMALTILYNQQNIGIKEVGSVVLSHNIEILVWGAIFIAFLSRIPIWPFHYWISSVNVNIANPLVFIIANIIPLTGVYGMIRFFPLNAPNVLSPYLLVLEILCIVTMLMIAFIGFINRDVHYKLFSYMTIFYIFYILGALLPTDVLLMNIGFSLFAYLIIIAAIEVLVTHIEQQRQCNSISECGILCNIKRTSFILSFLILAAVGMPLSALFLNNFVIFAGLLKFNIKMGAFILIAVILVSVNLLQQLFYLKYPKDEEITEEKSCVSDISNKTLLVMVVTIFLLIMSFINPLWFVG